MRTRNRLALETVVALAATLGFIAVRPAAAQPDQAGEALSARDLVKLAEEVEKEVEALRGWKFKRPVKKDVRSEKQLRAYIEKKVFEEEYGQGRLECLQVMLPMIGLIPADCDLKQTFMDVLFNQIGGFYDPDSGAFYLLQRGGVDYGPLVNRILIAHELTHALDDQHVDLNRFIKSREPTEDWTLAVGAVVEGSATTLMTRYSVRALLSGKYDLTELMQVVESETERSQAFLEAPPYFTALAANYMCGMTFLLRGNFMALAADPEHKGVGDDFLATVKDPPQSSEQILHPDKYWNADERDEPVVVKDEDVERLLRQPGLHVVHKNTMGELLCALLTFPADRKLDLNLMMLPSYWTNEAATGWGGDRFFLLAAGKDCQTARKQLKDVRGVWLTMWDTPRDRNEFIEDYATARKLPARRHFKRGALAVFLFGFDSRQAAEFEDHFLETLPAFRHGDKPWFPRPR